MACSGERPAPPCPAPPARPAGGSPRAPPGSGSPSSSPGGTPAGSAGPGGRNRLPRKKPCRGFCPYTMPWSIREVFGLPRLPALLHVPAEPSRSRVFFSRSSGWGCVASHVGSRSAPLASPTRPAWGRHPPSRADRSRAASGSGSPRSSAWRSASRPYLRNSSCMPAAASWPYCARSGLEDRAHAQPELRELSLGEHARRVPRGDVADLVPEHRGQLRLRVHVRQQAAGRRRWGRPAARRHSRPGHPPPGSSRADPGRSDWRAMGMPTLATYCWAWGSRAGRWTAGHPALPAGRWRSRLPWTRARALLAGDRVTRARGSASSRGRQGSRRS